MRVSRKYSAMLAGAVAVSLLGTSSTYSFGGSAY